MSLAEQYDRIERYLQGAMPPGELDEFTQKLAADSDLAAAVALHQEMGETLAGEKIHQFRQTLRRVDGNWRSTGGHSLRFLKNPRILALAASFLLLIGFFAWWGLQTPQLPDLAASNFAPLPLQTLMNSDQDAAQAVRKEAHQAYAARQYNLAAERFQTLSQMTPADPNHQLFMGISRIGAQQHQAAVEALQPLADQGDASVRQEAAWYLALAYLYQENATAARPYLQQLVEAEGFRWQQARDILKNLD